MLTSASSTHLARHTNIVHMAFNSDTLALSSTLYVFTHPKWRPWGNRLPTACLKCASPHSWSDVVKVGSMYSYSCRRDGCDGWCSFNKPEGFELFTQVTNGGCWMKKAYSVWYLLFWLFPFGQFRISWFVCR
jgi:hypothetical protein